MSKKRVLKLIIILLVLFVCILPIGFLIGIPIIQDWQTQRSIVVVDGAQYILDNNIRYNGNIRQKNLYYWSSKPLSEVQQFYQDFTITPFKEVNSYNDHWLIAAWKGSKITENPIRKVGELHGDFCDYDEVFDCVSITLFDASQSSLSTILQGMYNMNEIEQIPHSGTLIVFSYYIPYLS